MGRNASWGSSCSISYFRSGIFSNEPPPPHELNCGRQYASSVASIDTVLPDDMLEKIFSFLPVASVFKASSVCTRWHRVATRSTKCLSADPKSQRPWYFMFTCNDSPAGYAFDPNLRKWYNFELPCIERSNWFVSSSRGLLCFMDNDDPSRLFVCNPITRDQRSLKPPPGPSFPDYTTLAMSVDDPRSRSYTIAVAKTKLLSDDYHHSELSVHVYESVFGSWSSPVKEVLVGWRGGDEGVISDGVLYCLIHRTGVLGNGGSRHGLIAYDLFDRCSPALSTIPIPFPITCGRLMSLRSRLVMVGGIARRDRPDIIKGIGIWELQKGKGEWREVARMPHRLFQGFGEFDDVFASGGAGDMVFVQSYSGPALLAFDVSLNVWRWSSRCPVSKRFPLQLFTGFCFEPSFEISC